MSNQFANPIIAAEARAEQAESAAKLWRGLCVMLSISLMALGMLLGLIGHEHHSAVEQRVQQSLALPKN